MKPTTSTACVRCTRRLPSATCRSHRFTAAAAAAAATAAAAAAAAACAVTTTVARWAAEGASSYHASTDTTGFLSC